MVFNGLNIREKSDGNLLLLTYSWFTKEVFSLCGGYCAEYYLMIRRIMVHKLNLTYTSQVEVICDVDRIGRHLLIIPRSTEV